MGKCKSIGPRASRAGHPDELGLQVAEGASMAKTKKVAGPARREGGLHLAVELEDWVAITGTSDELEYLGNLLIGFARAEGQEYLTLDSPSPPFSRGSLGIIVHRIV
jgi:hypothetical protein